MPSGRAVSNEISSQRARWPRSTQGIRTCTLSIFYLRSYIIGGVGETYVGHSFLYLPECPIPLLGEDLTKLNAQVTFSLEKVDAKLLLGQACILQAVLWQWRDKLQPEVPEEILQKVRADTWVGGRPGRAKTADTLVGKHQPSTKCQNWKSNNL